MSTRDIKSRHDYLAETLGGYANFDAVSPRVLPVFICG
jgi:hypothetical protein